MSKLREVKIERAIKTRTVAKSLRCELTPEEQRVRGLQLAQTRKDLEDAQEQKKKVTEEWKQKVDALEKESSRSAMILRDGYEYRPIECRVEYDFQTATVCVIRTDLGALVDERPMTAEERQMTIDAAFEEVGEA